MKAVIQRDADIAGMDDLVMSAGDVPPKALLEKGELHTAVGVQPDIAIQEVVGHIEKHIINPASRIDDDVRAFLFHPAAESTARSCARSDGGRVR